MDQVLMPRSRIKHPKRKHSRRKRSPRARSIGRYVQARDVPEKHILDTSAWNGLLDDPKRDDLLAVLRTMVIIPTAIAISEIAAIQNTERRHALLRLVKTVGQDNRP